MEWTFSTNVELKYYRSTLHKSSIEALQPLYCQFVCSSNTSGECSISLFAAKVSTLLFIKKIKDER